jgi:NMD protein affecting ribosome stability and mRNA decay
VCEDCGAIFRDRRWSRGAGTALSHAVLAGAHWGSCPACKQTQRREYLGRVVVRGALSPSTAVAVKRRLRNVAARAEWTQPERRIVAMEPNGDGLEVLTTSQKLAHRMVHELKKAFGGRAAYRWSDDGSLFAVWSAPRESSAARAVG